VGALLARAAVRGARLNVAINAADLVDAGERAACLERADRLAAVADAEEERILGVVGGRMPRS
jgi:glutamate formiminotransferase/formiminotetrahydrofolate cyclodeaminase